MKILHINNYHYPRGGSDQYFLNVACNLAEKGHDVRTLATSDPRDLANGLRADIELPSLNLSSSPRAGEIAKFFYNAQARKGVQQLIAEFRPDVVHLHIYYGQITSSILAPIKAAAIPIVQTLHEYKIVCPAQSLLRNRRFCDDCRGRRYWHALLNRCNRGSLARSTLSTLEAVASELLGARRDVARFLAVSQYQRKCLIHMGLEEEKITTLHNFTRCAESPSDHPGDFYLYVGRIADGKGLETLFRAYKIYRETCAETLLPLHVVGTGPAEDYLKTMCRDLGLAETVRWLGYKSSQDLQSQYRKCRAIINPSEFNETFGLNNLEAMAHGRAVICSDRGAFPEVVRDNLDGYIARCGDAASFASLMVSMTREIASEMGRNGFARVQESFSPEKHIAKLEDIYAAVGKTEKQWH